MLDFFEDKECNSEMTMGSEAEYYLPSEREPKNYLQLSDETLRTIDTARERVLNAVDKETMDSIVAEVNEDLRQEGLVGRTVRLDPGFAIETGEECDIDSGALLSKPIAEFFSDSKFEGVFAGCRVESLGMGAPQELVYVVYPPLDEKGLRLRTVIAPVDASVLAVELETVMDTNEINDINVAFDILLMTGDEEVCEIADEMSAMIDDNEDLRVDAPFLRHLALLAIELLQTDAVKQDKQLRDAVRGIFRALPGTEGPYIIEGMGYQRINDSDIVFHDVSKTAHIVGSLTISDFEYALSADGTIPLIEGADTSQPAFAIRDEHGVEYILPIKFLQTFAEPVTMDCDSSMDRFLNEHPDIFEDPEKYITTEDILKKYFPNDEGGV